MERGKRSLIAEILQEFDQEKRKREKDLDNRTQVRLANIILMQVPNREQEIGLGGMRVEDCQIIGGYASHGWSTM